jgi:hypothetical protein
MIRHQNADAMVLASALMRGALAIGPWRQHFYDKLRLRQNDRKNQEVGLLYSLYSVT